MVLYNPEWAIIGIIHGMIGVFWVGIHFVNEAFLLPSFGKAEKLADMPMLRVLPKISIVATILGFLTLISGVIFLLVRFPIDPNGWLADAESRMVIIGLIMVVTSLGIGMAILRPAAKAFGMKAATLGPMAPLPEEMKKELARVGMFVHISSGLVIGTLVAMLLAINGGI